MLIQGAIYFLIFIGFIYLMYRWIAKPFLKSIGVKVDDDPEIKTDITERLKGTKKEHAKTMASVEAIRKEKALKADIANAESEIKETERIIEDEDFDDGKEPHVIISSLNNNK